MAAIRPLDNMLPSGAGFYEANASLTNHKRSRYIALRPSGGSDCKNVFSGKSRHAVMFPKARNMPALCIAVRNVVRVRPNYKVGRVNAGRVIAAMANNKPVRNWAFVLFVGNSVRPKILVFYCHLAVAVFVFGSGPNYAARFIVILAVMLEAVFGAGMKASPSHKTSQEIIRPDFTPALLLMQ